MQEVYKFIVSHYQILGSAIVFVVSLVLLIIKKKPVNDILSDIFQASILGILDAECSTLPTSEAKKIRCVNFVINYLHNKYPGLDTYRYRKVISSCIENILETPQKKGEK